MKILFLCKRRPQGKDLIDRPYGRFYYLPASLAEKGHEVHMLLLSYKNDAKLTMLRDNIHWTSISFLRHGPQAYIREAQKIIKQIKPELVGGFSDTYYGITAQRFSDKYNIPSLIDAYDNFESYIPWLKPLHVIWRKSLSKATLVTTAGPSLAELLQQSRPGKHTEIIPMAADTIFRPLDKIECRRKLGLAVDKTLIGYSGSTIHSSRGVNLLFEAYESLKKKLPAFELVLTGRKGRGVALPADANWLGYVPDADMPLLLNSLDLLVVLNLPSSFGNYSYPVKLYEAMKCDVPVVVTRTLATEWVMRNYIELLVEPNNVSGLHNKIISVLNRDNIHYGSQKNWQQIGEDFERLLLAVNRS